MSPKDDFLHLTILLVAKNSNVSPKHLGIKSKMSKSLMMETLLIERIKRNAYRVRDISELSVVIFPSMSQHLPVSKYLSRKSLNY